MVQHLSGRLGQRQPRRHRNGPGPEHQNGAGGGRRSGHPGQPGARHRQRHAKVPNASATAASSGADLNGAAINNACEQLRERLRPVAARLLACPPDTIEFVAGYARSTGATGSNDSRKSVPWPTLVKQAWLDRVGLSVTGFYLTPDIAYDFATLQGRAFYYFCYGAALSEVEIDTRTGEWWLRAVDIVHDVGTSINPAIDKGQVEVPTCKAWAG